MTLKELVEEEALKLLIRQVLQIKKWAKVRKKAILNDDKKYSISDCYIKIGKSEAFEEVERLVDNIVEEYKSRLQSED